ncbi:hypothetical protein LTR09_010002 [Extremus antarcticus]|uniref:Myb-like DNA-binding domain-containing protein n=1 Tax=Extremus antarcticus TaxID=702011 RepID=A0AAJ0DEL3_9PEZI|nr:hypothetical protein LTR09_010002 [Extremus antarcticus]
MASISNEQFLFGCIDNSNGGTVDWQKVADQCGIISNGAAAIKFKRMKDKFGTVDQAGGDEGKSPDKKDATPAKKGTPKSTSKKRKLDGDDEEVMDTPVKESLVKEEKEESRSTAERLMKCRTLEWSTDAVVFAAESWAAAAYDTGDGIVVFYGVEVK